MLIGLTGPARCGKDTVGNLLVEHHGYRRVAFADKMKQALYALNPWISPRYVVDPKKDRQRELEIKDSFEVFPTGRWELRDVVDKLGWEITKELPEVRGLLQRFGTEAGRNILGEGVWVRAAFPEGVDGRERVVVTDVRFDNEATYVRECGGVVVHVVRPGVGPVNGHVSDQGITAEFNDYTVENAAGLGELRGLVDGLVAVLGEAQKERPYVPGVNEGRPMASAYARSYLRR